MKDYPQTPVEFVALAIEEAKRRGAVSSAVDPVLTMAEKGQWAQAREVVDVAIRRTPDACSNLRTKLSWAAQWAQGRLPGTMQADLDHHQYSPEDIRDAWLGVISNGEYDPPRAHQSNPEEVVVTVDGKTQNEPKATKLPDPPKGVEVSEGDDYADIQDAINKGII